MSRLRRRVARAERSQRMTRDPVRAMLLVSPGQWTPEDEAVYWVAEAAWDQAAMDDLVERHTGEQPAPPRANQLVILIREVPSPAR